MVIENSDFIIKVLFGKGTVIYLLKLVFKIKKREFIKQLKN
jgi:hypothetical protein